jgi:fucose permease
MVIDNNSREEGLLISLGIFIIGIIIFISLRAVAEVIKVFIDIEENTRKAADKK